MKKFFAFFLVLVLVLSANSAFAAGKLSVEKENFYVTSGWSIYGTAFAKVTNTGDAPIAINTGLLEIYNAEGDALTSTDYYSDPARYLQPGEYTYVKIYDEIESIEEPSEATSYMLNITGKEESYYVTQRFPCTATYEPDSGDGYLSYDCLYATFTNDTDETVYGINVVIALLDAEGNILYVTTDGLYSSIGLAPGSSVTFCEYIDSDFVEYFEKNGLQPATVDSIAYVYVEEN